MRRSEELQKEGDQHNMIETEALTTEPADAELSTQCLTFVLDSEEYAIDILKVQEIKSWTSVTRVPKTPDHMLGVINLRGAIVPVIDLRTRFGLPQVEASNKTAVVIVRVAQADTEKVMGLVVDAVSEVYNFSPEQIQSNAAMTGTTETEFVLGLAKLDEKLVIILDLERILGRSDELAPGLGEFIDE